MKTNRWLDGSNRFFNVLLNLYPRDHRDDYAGSMRQVFSAQCSEAYSEKGFMGLFLLWLRILPDMGYTAIVEHLSSPQAAWGLLEPVPNAPLPWKGVFLVMLPGLVYMVSQIAQLNGEPWYLAVYYRAAFFLIIPVMIVWAVTRKFPIWGLIPLGLLFRLIQEIGYQMITLHPDAFSVNPVLNLILQTARTVESNLFIPAAIFALISAILAFLYFRKRPSTGNIKLWITAFIVTVMVQAGYYIPLLFDTIPYKLFSGSPEAINAYYHSSLGAKIPIVFAALGETGLLEFLQNSASYVLYNSMSVFLLIMLGTLFIPRHGFFTIFILVGYYLPVMLVGATWDLGDNPQMLVVMSVSVLLYRALLTFITPVWMSRTVTEGGKRKVIISCILLALLVHLGMKFYPSMMFGTIIFSDAQWVIPVLLEELVIVISFLLGITLYQNTPCISDPAAEKSEVFSAAETA